MMLKASQPTRSPAYRMGALVLFAAAAVILTALAFERFGGYTPCPLCLQERWAYYASIPALFVGCWLGWKLYGRLDEAQFRKVVLILLLVSGTVLVFGR